MLGGEGRMSIASIIVSVAILAGVGLLILVGDALADVGTSTKAALGIEFSSYSTNNLSNHAISLSSNPMTPYLEVMKGEEAKRKLIDAKNKGIIGNERHFFAKRALERCITPREIGDVVDKCEVLEEQVQKSYPRLSYKIRGITSSGRELTLIVAITKEGYLYVKTGWEV